MTCFTTLHEVLKAFGRSWSVLACANLSASPHVLPPIHIHPTTSARQLSHQLFVKLRSTFRGPRMRECSEICTKFNIWAMTRDMRTEQPFYLSLAQTRCAGDRTDEVSRFV